MTTSKKEFVSESARQKFFDTWCGDYLHFWPEWFFLAKDGAKTVAYLAVAPNSLEAKKVLSIPSLSLFDDQFKHFPAHLHINAHPLAQGGGIGSTLLRNLEKELRAHLIGGVHLITSPNARNVSFYEKNGFDFRVERAYLGTPLLFLGKKLASS